MANNLPPLPANIYDALRRIAPSTASPLDENIRYNFHPSDALMQAVRLELAVAYADHNGQTAWKRTLRGDWYVTGIV